MKTILSLFGFVISPYHPNSKVQTHASSHCRSGHSSSVRTSPRPNMYDITLFTFFQFYLSSGVLVYLSTTPIQYTCLQHLSTTPVHYICPVHLSIRST